MKLRNKKTGEIGNLVLNINPNRESFSVVSTENDDTICGNLVLADYDTLAELNEEWEDAPEEPKGKALYWMILTLQNFIENEPDDKWVDLKDCKQMLDKLKAWQRLRENHFKFDEYDILNQTATWLVSREYDEYSSDIDLLFGGGEMNERNNSGS